MNSQDIQNLQESYLAVYDDETRENLEFENWVNNLLDEGYDLSSYTWDEMAEIYIDEAAAAKGVRPYRKNKLQPLPEPKPLSGEKGDGSGYGKPKDGKDPLDTNKSDYNRFAKGLAPTKRTFGRPFGKYNPGTIKLNDILKKLPPQDKKKPSKEIVRRGNQNESYDLYDVILSHLIDEGYADTFESAEAIMVNMSEEWRQSIVEGDYNPRMANNVGIVGPPQKAIDKIPFVRDIRIAAANSQKGTEDEMAGKKPGKVGKHTVFSNLIQNKLNDGSVTSPNTRYTDISPDRKR